MKVQKAHLQQTIPNLAEAIPVPSQGHLDAQCYNLEENVSQYQWFRLLSFCMYTTVMLPHTPVAQCRGSQ